MVLQFKGDDMRRVARVDKTQLSIVVALRKAGCSVQHLHMLGRGCPDLLVGLGGVNLLLEVKNGEILRPSRRRLTIDEKEWHDAWRGQVQTVASVSEALQVVAELGAKVAAHA